MTMYDKEIGKRIRSTDVKSDRVKYATGWDLAFGKKKVQPIAPTEPESEKPPEDTPS